MQKYISHPAFPYCLPFAVCIVFLLLRDLHPLAVYAAYPLQTLAVGASILWVWKRLPSLKPSQWILSALVGILGCVLWVGLDLLSSRFHSFLAAHSFPFPFLYSFLQHDPNAGFNPWRFDSIGLVYLLIFFRVAGPTLVVPIMEEIFWRGFLMRYLIKEDFEQVPLGTYAPFSFIAVTVMFALIHGNQWFLGIVVGILYGAWFVYTKNLGNIIVSHGVTNFLLGAYVLKTKSWWFW